MPYIRYPVGVHGKNRPGDVRTVKRLLNQQSIPVNQESGSGSGSGSPDAGVGGGMDASIPYQPHLRLTGICDQATINAIRRFQRDVAHVRESGVVFPDSRTIFALNGLSGGTELDRVLQIVFQQWLTGSMTGGGVTVIGAVGGEFLRRFNQIPENLPARRSQLIDSTFVINHVEAIVDHSSARIIGSGIQNSNEWTARYTWGVRRSRFITVHVVRKTRESGFLRSTYRVVPSEETLSVRRDQLEAVIPGGL